MIKQKSYKCYTPISISHTPSVLIVVNAVFPHSKLSVVHDSSLGAGTLRRQRDNLLI